MNKFIFQKFSNKKILKKVENLKFFFAEALGEAASCMSRIRPCIAEKFQNKVACIHDYSGFKSSEPHHRKKIDLRGWSPDFRVHVKRHKFTVHSEFIACFHRPSSCWKLKRVLLVHKEVMPHWVAVDSIAAVLYWFVSRASKGCLLV